MKITPKGPDSLKVTRAAGGPEPRPAATMPPPATGTEPGGVQLSSLAASQLAAGEAPFNAESVERIKQAIRNGEFTVNAEVIADRLLEIELGLARQR
ncbi:MAG: flagellar biosynthesis anti-sigma factor FlgM [Pigmentiphaga sp.]|uniref:flagellar biosynthesis anti-sigma factor FlgM n=1 Tax=Pigmentiphaga sp. TaxID=1977564 RepID=UPI0029B05CEE|nr:flagellar biosynthesis anti-sigma factor FlgM [Pigmentiphaga sp.]MDX3904116.1 flagellar biosynthesis anti-sigma factor FlgM [Pigmentiphaga sp.]